MTKMCIKYVSVYVEYLIRLRGFFINNIICEYVIKLLILLLFIRHIFFNITKLKNNTLLIVMLIQ